MDRQEDINQDIVPPKPGKLAKKGHLGLDVGSGPVPFAGDVLSATSSARPGHDQDRINDFSPTGTRCSSASR